MNRRTHRTLPSLVALGVALALALLPGAAIHGAPLIQVPTPTPVLEVPEGFEVSDLLISPKVVAAGVPVTIRFTMTNAGTEEGDYAIGVLADDQTAATASGSLKPLAAQTHEASLSRDAPGTYVVRVGRLVDTFIIPEPRALLTALDVSPKIVGPGDPVRISLSMTNVGGFPDNYESNVVVGGKPVASFTGDLPARKSKVLLVTHAEERPGTYSVTAGRLTDQFIVMPSFVGRIREAPFINPDTTRAIDDLDRTLTVTGERILQDETDEFVIFGFPVALDVGRILREFRDAASNIAVVDNQVNIPVRDEEGREVMRITGEVAGVRGTGDAALVRVRKDSLHLLLRERQFDLTLSDPRLGRVAVGADASLLDLPRVAQVEMRVKKALPPALQDALQRAAQEEGNAVTEMGFVVELDSQNLESGVDLGPVIITFKVGRSWVDAQPGRAGSVRIMRLGDEGNISSLETSCDISDAEERYVCTALSPEGWSTFVLLSVAPPPSDLRFAGLSVDPGAVEPGEAVQVSLRAVNEGDGTATATLILEVNSEPETATTVILQPGQSREVTFLIAREREGSYLARVAGLTARFDVATTLDPTLLEVSGLFVLPKTNQPGGPIRITVEARNGGLRWGKFDIPLMLNGVLADVQSVALNPGESRFVTFIVEREEKGKYMVDVQGLTDSFEVRPVPVPPAFTVTGLTMERKRVPPGLPVNVTALVSNSGEEGGDYIATLLVNGEVQGTQEVFLEGLSQVPVNFEVLRTEPGLYLVKVGVQSVRFEVTPGEAPQLLISLGPTEEKVELGATISVGANFANLSASSVGQTVQFKVNGEVVEARTVTLGPTAVRTEAFAFTPGQTGTYELDIAGQTVSVEVTEPSEFPWTILINAILLGLAMGQVAGIGYLLWWGWPDIFRKKI